MHKLGILLKTYADDLEYVKRLIPSYNKYNIDDIPLYIVVPELNIDIFKQFKNQNIEILSEELFKDKLTTVSVTGIKPGYINQEIIKLSFWEEELCENYFCLDSDGVFIRDFYYCDFMFNDNIPYSILFEDNELKVEPEYYKSYWVPREEKIRQIQKELELVDRRMLTCHGMTVLSSKVLASFKKDFLEPRNISYIDILQISPYEFSWYNMWLQKTETIPLKIREPLFKVFHHENHLKDYKRRGTTIDDISRGFIGIIINSNWQSNMDIDKPIQYQNYILKEKAISEFSFTELIFEAIQKIKIKLVNNEKYFKKNN